ncbi:hypothetical protein [Galbibacter mesophilus]|uniref:hypothetical protein n=1 Tax=Galbibacter mesophilus TaxID=379069 RepID=UPI00191DC5BD|nr:hypothetical protein [Galbibacter mesophilus]MCM5662993.1 hypothetical protein [Galbibacter mesophilus]
MEKNSPFLDVYNRINTKTNTSLKRIKFLLENDDITASDELYSFLNEIEDLLRRNNMAAFTDIATYRTNFWSSRVAFDQRVPQKKFQLQKASELLPNISQTLEGVLQPIKDKIDLAKKEITALAVKAFDSNMIQQKKTEEFSAFIENLWEIFLQHDNFKERALFVSNTLHTTDIHYLLTEAIQTQEK